MECREVSAFKNQYNNVAGKNIDDTHDDNLNS